MFREKEIRRMGQKQNRNKTERATGLGRRKNMRSRKVGSNLLDSPEIQDRGETSEIPRPPFGGIGM